jgi:hypothetical protein
MTKKILKMERLIDTVKIERQFLIMNKLSKVEFNILKELEE